MVNHPIIITIVFFYGVYKPTYEIAVTLRCHRGRGDSWKLHQTFTSRRLSDDFPSDKKPPFDSGIFQLTILD
jgi:hypothetical protein